MSIINVRVNDFEIEVSSGYPHWVTIKHEGKVIKQTLHYKEMRDLQYALKRARASLRHQMPSPGPDEV